MVAISHSSAGQGESAMSQEMQSLQNGIQDRQRELRDIVPTLARKAYVLQKISNAIRTLTILLSALTSIRGVADTVWGKFNVGVMASFALLGVVTTVLLGLEAAFKFDKRSAELNILSATARATVISVDTEWRQNIGSYHDTDLRDAARKLLTRQDSALAEIHQKAANLGLNLSLTDRTLEDPDWGPYLA